ncbi:MAG TPA: nucleotidyltransferase domain-containing protein [Chloroflexia bacterium]|nr:nucleotidyltransferase domain-containing protein [Chloroflexia bacterium]
MIEQREMIERVRQICREDPRLVAALMYGSFTRGEGDAYSDIEFVLFFRDEEIGEVDQLEWVRQIAPVEMYFVNEFGNGTAIFSNLVRGEFHFDKASDMRLVQGWKDSAWFPSLEATIMVDHTGELARLLRPYTTPPQHDTPEQVRALCERFINWVLFGANVLARGEHARALEILGMAHRYLLWLARLAEGRTEHWPTPSKSLERDISPATYARFKTCTASLDEGQLWHAYDNAWKWGKELMTGQAEKHGIALPTTVISAMDARLAGSSTL